MNETFTIKELAEYLKISISEIRYLVRNKSIPHFRIGAKLFFKKASIDNWIYEKELKSMQDTENKIKIKTLKGEVSENDY